MAGSKKAPGRVRQPIPANVEIIDLDTYEFKESYMHGQTIDLENDTFNIKQEPAEDSLQNDPFQGAPSTAEMDEAIEAMLDQGLIEGVNGPQCDQRRPDLGQQEADVAQFMRQNEEDLNYEAARGAGQGVIDVDSVAGATSSPTGRTRPGSARDLTRLNKTGHHNFNLGSSILGSKKVGGRMTEEERTALIRQQEEMSAMFLNSQAMDIAPPPRSRKVQSHSSLQESEKCMDYEQKYKRAKAEFSRKKRAGTRTLQDEIAFSRAESEYDAARRKAQRDREYEAGDDEVDNEPGLFVNSDDEAVEEVAFEDSDSESEAVPSRKRKTAGKGAKRKKNVGDLTDHLLEEDVPGSKKRKVQSKRPGANKAEGKKAKAKGKGKAKGGKKGPVMTNANSMMHSDVFRDTAQNADLNDQPIMTLPTESKRRPDALKSLIASVPAESRKIANADKKYLEECIKDFTGSTSVKPHEDGNWVVNGMISSLKHYQVLGVAFMRRRENATQQPKGGILADEMGLGKTVMMLANIVNGRPPPQQKRRGLRKTTLIIASPALVDQWFEEIEKHCISGINKKNGIGRIYRYKSGGRRISDNDVDLLKDCDVVLTTWYELNQSYPMTKPPLELTTRERKDAWWKEWYESEKGVLHRVPWLRVVLDEAHQIKNHKTRSSLAARALDSKHSWAITGTPILNNVAELFPYFKFIREPHAGDLKIFKENFCTKGDPQATEKLHVFLQKFMIRRTHLDTLFNARLLDLPKPSHLTVWVEFNDIERNIYEIVRTRFIARINGMSRSGTLAQSKSHIWTMLLRLRQLCGHTLMIQSTIMDLLEREDFERLNKLTEREGELNEDGEALIGQLRKGLASAHGIVERTGLGTVEIEAAHNTEDDLDDYEGLTGGKYGVSVRFRKYLQSLRNSEKWEELVARTHCCGCRQLPDNPWVTSCFHIYCWACLKDLQHQAARKGHDVAPCTECGSQFTSSQKCEEIEIDGRETTMSVISDTDADTQGSQALLNSSKKGKGKRKKTSSQAEDWISMRGEILPSAKTVAVKAQILNWLTEDPSTKIIVYTQFLEMVRILGKICDGEQWGYVRYTGSMSQESRSKAIEEFAAKPSKNILLASLKCGGLGLNLTMANRVICIDPWWNQAIEQQAFCRVFRIGQEKETSMTRLVVRNTVDDYMMRVKDDKQVEIDEVMSDSKRPERMSVKDLMGLFGGSVGEDDEGKPFIFADDHEDGTERPLGDSEDEDEGGFRFRKN
ncbi:hypothetical protein M8818_001106 [Zalaria obscura]|uniref:Uncharacterized protein n=1 Tax=Zalaria obscura TaxID=2024903 RepID=A0ACC3SM98_9PEZI